MALEPNLWGTLPEELLHLVFARLPAIGIGQLRVLSKEWKMNVDCKDSDFSQVLDATTHLNMFALLNTTYFYGVLTFDNIYDVQANKWHVHDVAEVPATVEILDANGGLVCGVLNRNQSNNELGLCVVLNPLTKQKTELPRMLCMEVEMSKTLVKMVKLTVDKKTKEYKVFVVSSIIRLRREGFFAQVYDSRIKEWTIVEATQGHIFGWEFFFLRVYDVKFFRSVCKYNCADGTLQQFNDTEIAAGLEVELGCCVLLEDHLFVLHKEASLGPPDQLEDGENMPPKYCISEYHLPKKATAWVKLKVQSHVPRKCFCDSPHNILKWRLAGCNGFLLVHGDGDAHSWLYNLSTCEWRNVPAFKTSSCRMMMCGMSWSAMP